MSDSLPDLYRRIDRVERALNRFIANPPRDGRHGKHGRNGIDGRNGKDGPAGRDGVCPRELVDEILTREAARLAIPRIEQAIAAIPLPKDGKDGVAPPELVDAILTREAASLAVPYFQKAIDAIPLPKDGAPGERGPIGKAGSQGVPGPAGTAGATGPVGPMPAHEWDGTRLRFEQAPGGIWGEAVDLQGQKGRDGRNSGGGGGSGSAIGGATGATGPIGATGPAGGGAGATMTCVRLTLTSGEPITTSDVIGATNVYVTPYNGNQITLWDSDANEWVTVTFSEITLAIGTVTSDIGHDVFGYLSGGTMAAEKLSWANASARATGISWQDGRLCKTGDKTRLWLGSFYSTSTTTTEDSGGGTTTQVGGKRFLFNAYNRVERPLKVIDTTNSWTYETEAWRQANGASGNKIEYFSGYEGEAVKGTLLSLATPQGAIQARSAMGLDSTTAPTGFISGCNSGSYTSMSTPYAEPTGLGYHYIAWMEWGSPSNDFYGDNSGHLQNGMSFLLKS